MAQDFSPTQSIRWIEQEFFTTVQTRAVSSRIVSTRQMIQMCHDLGTERYFPNSCAANRTLLAKLEAVQLSA